MRRLTRRFIPTVLKQRVIKSLQIPWTIATVWNFQAKTRWALPRTRKSTPPIGAENFLQ
jgi:hypothetical protein